MRRWLIAAMALAALGAGLGYAGLAAYDAPGPLLRAQAVVVPHGGLAAVGQSLQQSGVVRSALELRVFAILTLWQGNLRAAELSFPQHASIAATLLVLRTGRPVEHLLTIPEGVTSARVAELLSQASALTGDVTLPAEGGVLPQTYAYERGTSRQAVLQRAELALDRALSHVWATRATELKLQSPQELLVIASLVERETHLPAERPIVARVFYNRLAHGMRLQSDPTVVYGATGGLSELPGGLTRAELERPTPYNTYVVAGLPPGPICNPGLASIEAAAHPARSDALYFVADGTGGHSFSDSLGEHTKNVERYRRLGHGR